MSGIDNPGPSLVIINLIANKKIKKKNKLKFFFLKSEEGKAVEKRLKNNILPIFLNVRKGNFFLKKNGHKIVNFYNLIKKICRLKSDI